MAVWIANIDESGVDRDSSYACVASVLGTAESWGKLRPFWRDILNKYGIAFFHATEFNCGEKQCKHLSEPERVNCVKELIALISNYELEYVAHVIDKSMFDSVAKAHLHLDLSVYDYLLSTNICDLDIRVAIENSPGMYVFIEDGCSLSTNLCNELMKVASRRKLFQMVGHISYMNKREYEPVQVADMIVYDTFKYFQNMAKKLPNPVRKSFEKIMQGNPLRPYLIDEDWLRQDLPKIDEFVRKIGIVS